MFNDGDFAAYFIATATWVRQVAPLESERLPVLLAQTKRPLLRVREEKVRAEAAEFDRHVLVYSIPSRIKAQVRDALSALLLVESIESACEDSVLLFDRTLCRIVKASGPPWRVRSR